MTKNKTEAGTFGPAAGPSREWTTVQLHPNQSIASSPDVTRGVSSESVVIVQGRYDGAQLIVSVDPIAIDRKVAIRQLNDQSDGRMPASNTSAHG